MIKKEHLVQSSNKIIVRISTKQFSGAREPGYEAATRKITRAFLVSFVGILHYIGFFAYFVCLISFSG